MDAKPRDILTRLAREVRRRVREQIALVVGEANACSYCLAAHTASGKRAGLTEEDMKEARRATSDDEKEQTALVFARKVVQDRGVVPMPMWNNSAGPATMGRLARSWPTSR